MRVALELAFALLALLVLGRGLLLGSRDSACLLAALALVLQGARLAVERLIGGSPFCQTAQAQDDGQRIEASGRCESERDGSQGEVRRDPCPSALASDVRGAERDDRERCMLCGPGAQQVSAASSRCSSAPDNGFRPCVLCGGTREPQRAAARAQEVRALWRLPQSPVQPACTVLRAGTSDEVARASSPGPSTPSAAPADQADRGRDAQSGHTATVELVRLGADEIIANNATVGMNPLQIAARRRMATHSDKADAWRARRLEAAEGTRAMIAFMAARA